MNNYQIVDEIRNDFNDYFPSFSRRTVDFYRSGRFEITVIFDDGRKAYYNYLTKNIRIIHLRSDEYSEESWKHQFAITLTRKLADKQMTKRELSDATGISQMSLSNYTNEKSIPSAYAITRIADALECSVSELIDFDI